MLHAKNSTKSHRAGRRGAGGGGTERARPAPALAVGGWVGIYFEGRPKRLGCGWRLVVVVRIARRHVTVLDPFYLLLTRIPAARAARMAEKWTYAGRRGRFNRVDRRTLLERSREFDRIGMSYGRDAFLRALHELAVAGRPAKAGRAS